MTGPANDIVLNDFEKVYNRLLEKEGRIYSDEQVARFPEIAETHPHFKEWQVRKESLQKLVSYLKERNERRHILEIGCGNGWLSHQLAALPGSSVIGMDINFTAIRQAATVFGNIPNLHFIYAHALRGMFEETKFDLIVFAESLHYFPSLKKAIRETLPLLKPEGEIHIINTQFYPLSALSAAKERSLIYFETAGFPEMINRHFHHTLEELDVFNYSILYDPDSLFNRFLKYKNPFYWIRVQQH